MSSRGLPGLGSRLPIALLCACLFFIAPAADAGPHATYSTRAESLTPRPTLSITLSQLVSPIYSTLGNAFHIWLPGARALLAPKLDARARRDRPLLDSVLSKVQLGRFNLIPGLSQTVQLSRPVLPVQDRYMHDDAQYQPFVGLRYLLRFDGPPGDSRSDDWNLNFALDRQYH